ncbi:hypothetical protein EAH69_11100 [Faecalibacter macacae]|uniref:Uncharacterized protein n=1 Tax=Faecalibacter macacae TaxID=1859289 RepID=A0A3L9M961_9FLAO|nr:hypothetical protein EAH69_11100 [Faecalibacter macacae]
MQVQGTKISEFNVFEFLYSLKPGKAYNSDLEIIIENLNHFQSLVMKKLGIFYKILKIYSIKI